MNLNRGSGGVYFEKSGRRHVRGFVGGGGEDVGAGAGSFV